MTLQVAGEVFAEKGFKDTTVREICARANVNLAAINYHFGDKERLYIEAVKNAKWLIDQDVPMPQWDEATSSEEKLKTFIFTLMRRLMSPKAAPWQHRLLLREISEPSKACEELVQESFLPFVDLLCDIVSDLMPEDIPDHIVKQLALSIIAQCVYYRFNERVVEMMLPTRMRKKYFHPEALAEHIARFSLAAIRSYDSITEFSYE